MRDIVLLWVAKAPDGLAIAEREASARKLLLVQCQAQDMSLYTVPSASRQPVIAIVDDEPTAIAALAAGVDEVVRQGELTADGLDRAVTRAMARGEGRALAQKAARTPDESDALGSLLDWIAIELVACVSGAVLEGEHLEEAVRALLATRDSLAPESDALPTATDALEMLETVRESFHRTHMVLQAVRGLSGADEDVTWLEPLFASLSRILANRAMPLADLEVEADARCATSLRAPRLVGVLVTLVDSALDRAARAHRPNDDRVRITLRASIADGAAVIEIEDDAGDGGGADSFRPDPIAEVRARLRDEGCEVLASTAAGRLTVRLVLPLAKSDEGPSLDGGTRKPMASSAN